MDNDIEHMIAMRLVDQLTLHCQTNIIKDDLTKADVVKFGRFQADPVKTKVYISVAPGDPDKAETRSGLLPVDEFNSDLGFEFPIREIGGNYTNSMWYFNGTVNLGCYYIKDKLDEVEASRNAHVVIGRIKQVVANTPIHDLKDTFGAGGVRVFVYANSFNEGGGPPNQYIWRGKVYYAALCNVPYA